MCLCGEGEKTEVEVPFKLSDRFELALPASFERGRHCSHINVDRLKLVCDQLKSITVALEKCYHGESFHERSRVGYHDCGLVP